MFPRKKPKKNEAGDDNKELTAFLPSEAKTRQPTQTRKISCSSTACRILPSHDEAAVISGQLRAVEGLQHLDLLLDAVQVILGGLQLHHLPSARMFRGTKVQEGRRADVCENVCCTMRMSQNDDAFCGVPLP